MWPFTHTHRCCVCAQNDFTLEQVRSLYVIPATEHWAMFCNLIYWHPCSHTNSICMLAHTQHRIASKKYRKSNENTHFDLCAIFCIKWNILEAVRMRIFFALIFSIYILISWVGAKSQEKLITNKDAQFAHTQEETKGQLIVTSSESIEMQMWKMKVVAHKLCEVKSRKSDRIGKRTSKWNYAFCYWKLQKTDTHKELFQNLTSVIKISSHLMHNNQLYFDLCFREMPRGAVKVFFVLFCK